MKKSRKKSKTHSNSQKVTTKVKIVTTKVKKTTTDKQSNIHDKSQIVTTKVKGHENIRSQRKSRNVTGNVKKSQKK